MGCYHCKDTQFILGDNGEMELCSCQVFKQWVSLLDAALYQKYGVQASSLYTEGQLRDMHDTGDSPIDAAVEIAHEMAAERSLDSAAPLWED